MALAHTRFGRVGMRKDQIFAEFWQIGRAKRGDHLLYPAGAVPGNQRAVELVTTVTH